MRRGFLRKMFVWLLFIVLAIVGLPVVARVWVHQTARGRVFSRVENVPNCRVALVLGCKVRPDGSLSLLLRDRVDMAVALYKAGKVEKLLMSGDNRFSHYDEPTRMAEYAARHGVDPKDVVMDFAGRRTYDSIYRAKHIFGQDRLVVVSQGFHVERALFLCDKLGVEAYGAAADAHAHMGGRILKARIREIPACLSAVMDIYVRRPSPVMGSRETIP